MITLGTKTRRTSLLAAGILMALGMVQTAGAQPAPASPVDQTAEFASVRAKFENMTASQVAAAGYMATPECVSSPLGGMGIHAVNVQVLQGQLQSGKPDSQNPPVVLLDSSMTRVVGVEWEIPKSVTPAPMILGQTMELQPGHPGMEGEHYMFHAYFKPNNQVLMAPFDPAVTCAAASGGMSGGMSGAPGMPRTGDGTSSTPLTLLAVGLLSLVAGLVTRRAHRAPR